MTDPVSINFLKAQLNAMRQSVRGKTFSEAPEAFKHIEGIKAHMAYIKAQDHGRAKDAR